MPKKKQPRNAFFFFMLDYRKDCESLGERFPNGLRDVQGPAGEEWNKLSSSKRKWYEDMAKQEKARLKGDSSQKVTCLNNTIASIDCQQKAEEDYKNAMFDYIEQMVVNLVEKKALTDHKFYLIHVNYFCISEGECYHPAELAISEFSLEDGVTQIYHTIIDPGELPLGYREEAFKKSDTTHRIPVLENPGNHDFYNIFQNIKHILEPGKVNGKYPPMYTLEDHINRNTSISAARNVMYTLCRASVPEEDPDDYPIYSLEKLFFELQKASASISINPDAEKWTMQIAEIQLEGDVFNLTPNIACEFHEKLQDDAVQYCSKSYVQRWVYLMCDNCCEGLDIKLIPGKHVPPEVDVAFRQKQEDREREAFRPRDVSLIEHSQLERPSTSSWVPREQPPLARPQVQANLSAMLPTFGASTTVDISQENFPPIGGGNRPLMMPRLQEPDTNNNPEDFPAIPVGRGRGRLPQRGRGRAPTFAEAMRK